MFTNTSSSSPPHQSSSSFEFSSKDSLSFFHATTSHHSPSSSILTLSLSLSTSLLIDLNQGFLSMPEILSTTIDTPSNELDLNSADTQKKFTTTTTTTTTTTQSSVTIGVSEGGNTDDQVRVSTSEVGTSTTQSSDALVEERNSNQELVVPLDEGRQQTVIEVEECTTITTESVEVRVMDDMEEVFGTDALDRNETAAQLAGTVHDQVFFDMENRNDGACVTVDSSSVAEGSQQDGNSNLEVQVNECHDSEEEEGECSRETNEFPVEQFTDDVGGELGEMDNMEVMEETNCEVSGTDADAEENEWLEADAYNVSAGCHPNGDHGLNENDSIQDTEQKMINQITEDDCDEVDGTERMDLHPPGEENQDVGVTVDSSLRSEVSDVCCQPKAECSSSLHSGDNPDSARLTASIKSFVDENLGLEVQVTEGRSSEDREKAEIQFAGEECSMVLNESLVEHNKQIKAVAVENVVSVTEVLHENPLGAEKDRSLETKAVGGSAASFATGNLGHEENTSKQADRHETVVQLVETTIDSSSLSKIPDGSQGAGAFYFPKGKSDPDSADITEFVRSFSDTSPDSAVQVIESHALEITQVAKTVSNKVDRDERSSPPSGKNPNEGDYVKVDSRSLANNVTDESQGIACASLPIESFQSFVDRNLDTGVQGTEGRALEDDVLKTGVDDVKLGVSTVITQALVEQVQDVGGETTVMEKNEVAEAECITSGSDALDGNSICAEEYQSLQAEPMGESSKSSHGDAYVTAGSDLVAKVSDACDQITDSSGLLDGNLDSELQVTEDHDIEDEEQKSGVETVKAGGSMTNNEALFEQIQVVGGQVTALDNEESFKTKDDASGTKILDGSPTCQEKTQSFEAEAIYWNTDPHPNLNPSHEENTSMLDGKQVMVSQLTEMNSEQVHRDELSNSYSVQDCLNIEDCPSAYSSLAVEVIDGSQSTGISASLETNLDSDIRNHMALLHEDQNMASHAFEIDASLRQFSHTPDTEVATESAGGSSNLDGSQITKSNVLQAAISELNTNECIMDSLVKDFCIRSGTERNQNTGGEVVNETVSAGDLICGNGDEHGKMEGDVDFSVLDPLDDDAAVDAREVSLDGNQGFEQPKDTEEQAVTSVALQSETALEKESVVSYYLTPEMEGDFSVSDLVWGKVRSHPWWPGQVFDSSDSSEQAMKYHKNDNYLVAYFGDQTFAWNEASSMKHFRTHFSQMQKQASSEAFRVAVDGALDEVSRRVELGMTCSCTPEEICSKVKSQIIDNAGIREGARRRDGVDKSLSVSSFQPDNFVQYIKGLALHPRGESDRVELVIAQAQLTALYRLKGYFRLPEFHVFKGLSESDVASSLSGARKHSEEVVEHAIPFSENEEHASFAEVQLESQEMVEHAIPVSGNEVQASTVEVQLENQESSSRKRKHISEDSSNSSKKERNMSELLTGENLSSFHDNDGNDHCDEKAVIDSASLSSGKEPEVDDSFLDDAMVKNRKERLSPSRDTEAEPPTPQSFKVGDCIRRIASQLTGAPPILMSRGERFQESAVKVDGVDCSPKTYEGSHGRRVVIPKEFSYPDEMLSQLCLAARDPMKGYSFLTIIVDFFSEFRNSIVLDCKSEKMGIGNTVAKKLSNTKISSVEMFDFEDTNDSYWTDRIVQLQGVSDEQPPLKACKENTYTDKDSTSIKPGSDSDNKSSRKNRKRKGESGTWVDDPTGNHSQPGNSLQVNPSLNSKQQNIDGSKDLSMKKSAPKPRRRKVACVQTPAEKNIPFVDKLNPKLPYNWQNLDVNIEKNNAPTALILSFTEIRSIPSEVNLNKIFGRFGPLMFSETEVSEETNSARVVFKRRNDAEVALSSATAFRIFGSASVSYQLMYWSPTPSKASSFTVGGQDVTFMEGNKT